MPNPEALEQLLCKAGIPLQPKQLHRLWTYHQLLRKHNKDRDLTRITGFEPMVLKHYVDSMILGKFTEIPNQLLDIGTGPGLPGIPLKILYPDMQLILAEHRPKRVQFLKECCKALHFKNVGIFAHKVIPENFHTPVQGVITRALEDMKKTMYRVEPFLKDGGRILFMKGPAVEEEFQTIEQDPKLVSLYEKTEDHEFQLPILNHERRLVVFQKKKRKVLDILFEDEHLVVVNKQPGWLSVPTSHSSETSVQDEVSAYLQQKGQKPALAVHRLDRMVSGVLIFAKTKLIREQLFEQFKSRKVKKTYVALVEKEFEIGKKGKINLAINDNRPHSKVIVGQGEPAETEFEVKDAKKGVSFLELKAQTGRRHQIRVHLANALAPIVGDTFYGGKENGNANRVLLHCQLIQFRHPKNGEQMEMKAPLPEDMQFKNLNP